MDSATILKEPIQVGIDKLRVHHDWIDGKWVKPPNQVIEMSHQSEVETDQAHLSEVGKTSNVEVSKDSVTKKKKIIKIIKKKKIIKIIRKRKIKNSTPESDSNFASPCKKSKNGESAENSLSLITHPESTMPTSFSELSTSTTEVVEAPLHNLQDKCQNLTDMFLSSSEGLSDHITRSFCQKKIKEEVQCDSSSTPVQSLQINRGYQSSQHSIRSLCANEIKQQIKGLGKQKPTTFGRTSGKIQEMISKAPTKDPISETPSREITDAVHKECLSTGTQIIVGNIEDVKPLSMWSEGSHFPAMQDYRVSLKPLYSAMRKEEHTNKITENGTDENVMQDHNRNELTVENEKLPLFKVVKVEDCETVMQDHNLDVASLENRRFPFITAVEDGENEIVMQDNIHGEVTVKDAKFPSPKDVEDGKGELVVQDQYSDEDMDTNSQGAEEKTNQAQPSQVGNILGIGIGNESNTRKRKVIKKIRKKKVIKIIRKKKIANTIEDGENEIVKKDNNTDEVILDNGKFSASGIGDGEDEAVTQDHKRAIVTLEDGDLSFTEAVEDGENETIVQEHNCDELTSMDESLPFTKSYSMWKDLESRDIFLSTSQKPHFQPLNELGELLREGQAFGFTLSFANFADKIRKVKHDESKSALERKLKALVHFEALGFNVQPIRARIEDLVRLKDSRVQLDGMLKQLEGKISKGKHDEESVKAKVYEIDGKLGELHESYKQMNEKLQMLEMKKQIKGSGIAALQGELHKSEYNRLAVLDNFSSLQKIVEVLDTYKTGD
ncbi:hypothetical protein FRX31_028276 [Thalictrum thalictroides]|uniref:Uncharacterized protein n=1 Tax=Thalictrum thalictroides TaxID=46969 RepID=A0A7J6VBL9_THATH|nr:hypothetical protein FRX31_028276 [Thalictrum thalictroides]